MSQPSREIKQNLWLIFLWTPCMQVTNIPSNKLLELCKYLHCNFVVAWRNCTPLHLLPFQEAYNILRYELRWIKHNTTLNVVVEDGLDVGDDHVLPVAAKARVGVQDNCVLEA